jgi:hypothetical protein
MCVWGPAFYNDCSLKSQQHWFVVWLQVQHGPYECGAVGCKYSTDRMHVEHANLTASAAFREKFTEWLIFGYLGAGKLIGPREEGNAVSRDMFRRRNARHNHNTKMANKYHKHTAKYKCLWTTTTNHN